MLTIVPDTEYALTAGYLLLLTIIILPCKQGKGWKS